MNRFGSVRQIINSYGSVVKYSTFEPFGESIESGGTFDDPFGFTGQYFDAEIGEYYLRARQYNPAISRFTARDPVFGKLELPLSLHKYLYCENDGVNRTDPSGQLYADLNVSYSYGIKDGFLRGGFWGGLAGGITITSGAMLGANGGKWNDYYYFGGGYTLSAHGGRVTTLTASPDTVGTGWNSALTITQPTGGVIQIGWNGAIPRFTNREKMWYDWCEFGQVLNKEYRGSLPLPPRGFSGPPDRLVGPITLDPIELYQWAKRGSVSLTSFYVWDWDIASGDWIDTLFAAGEMFGSVPSSLGLNTRNVMFSEFLGGGE